jgi:hypothetical protein
MAQHLAIRIGFEEKVLRKLFKPITKFGDLILEPFPEQATMPPIFLGGKRRRSSINREFGRNNG